MPFPYSSLRRSSISMRVRFRTGREDFSWPFSTARAISSHRKSARSSTLAFGRSCTSPAGPEVFTCRTQFRIVLSATPSSAALAAYRCISGVPGA